MLIFDMKLKTSLPVIWLENIDFEKSGSVRMQRTQQTDPDPDPVDDEDWRDRPRTDPPVSDLGTGLGSSSLNELISARLYRDSFVQLREILSSINWSRLPLVQVRISYPVSYRVSYRASYFDLYLLNMNLNKGRD
jgi:hypothetical protein